LKLKFSREHLVLLEAMNVVECLKLTVSRKDYKIHVAITAESLPLSILLILEITVKSSLKFIEVLGSIKIKRKLEDLIVFMK